MCFGTTSSLHHKDRWHPQHATIPVPRKDGPSLEIWAYTYLTSAYKDHLAKLLMKWPVWSRGSYYSGCKWTRCAFQELPEQPETKVTRITGSGQMLVQGNSLWQVDPNRAFNCWPWVGGEPLLTHSASCCRIQTVLEHANEYIIWGYLQEQKKALLWWEDSKEWLNTSPLVMKEQCTLRVKNP